MYDDPASFSSPIVRRSLIAADQEHVSMTRWRDVRPNWDTIKARVQLLLDFNSLIYSSFTKLDIIHYSNPMPLRNLVAAVLSGLILSSCSSVPPAREEPPGLGAQRSRKRG